MLDIYERKIKAKNAPDWTLDDKSAVIDKNQPRLLGGDGKPLKGNSRQRDTWYFCRRFYLSKATQTTVLSLTALRRLRFPKKVKLITILKLM